MLVLADISEFQKNIDAPTYLGAGHTCLIVRAHNGWRMDHMWPLRRDYVRGFKFDAIGYYQYLVAGRPAGDQARDFIRAVGPLRPNEFVILDLEEGSGNQTDRAQVWFSIVDAQYKRQSTLYSYLFFGRDQLNGWESWHRPRWIADIHANAPSDPHELWQNTDKAVYPGISSACDSSIFQGSKQDFLKTFCQADMTPAPAPTPQPTPQPTPPIKEDTVISVATKPDGSLELFYEADNGEVFHTWQSAPNSAWHGAEAGKRHAGWESMGVPQDNRV